MRKYWMQDPRLNYCNIQMRAGVTHKNTPPRKMEPDSHCVRPEMNTKIDEWTTENQYHNAESVPQRDANPEINIIVISLNIPEPFWTKELSEERRVVKPDLLHQIINDF